MLVIDAPSPERDSRMRRGLVAEREGDRVDADEHVDGVSAPAAGHGVDGAGDGGGGVVTKLRDANLSAIEGRRQGSQRSTLAGPWRGSRRVSVVLRVEADLQGRAHMCERRALRQWHQVLPANVSASTLHASLVVS